jgi:hypothetical protein
MQDLYLVFGGELTDVSDTTLRDPKNVHVVGIFASRQAAHDEWKANAQRTVDNALMRYFVVPLSEEMHAFSATVY